MLARISNTVYRSLLACAGESGSGRRTAFRALYTLRRLLIAVADPEVYMTVGDVGLWMHLSHDLPLYRRRWPMYDRALSVIVSRIAQSKPQVHVVDVGANIGDSSAALLKDVRVVVTCVEADKNYLKLLARNLARYGERVSCVNTVCGDGNSEAAMLISRCRGTSRFIVGDVGGQSGASTTLDCLVGVHPRMQWVDLLKIDTDGFDCKVLRGAIGILRRCSPMLFFEWDPKLLRDQGEDPAAVFEWLRGLGYRDVVVFSNFGECEGRVDLAGAAIFCTSRLSSGTALYADVLAVHEASALQTSDILSALRGAGWRMDASVGTR